MVRDINNLLGSTNKIIEVSLVHEAGYFAVNKLRVNAVMILEDKMP